MLIFYVYAYKRKKNPNAGKTVWVEGDPGHESPPQPAKLRVMVFAGVVKAETGKAALKKAQKRFGELKGFTVIEKSLVAKKLTGKLKPQPKAPWVGKANWMKLSRRYYKTRKGP